MTSVLKKLGAAAAGTFFGFGLLIGGVLGAYEGSKPEHQQEPWQKNLHAAATFLDKLIDPDEEPNPPDGCREAGLRLYNAERVDGAPAYVLRRLREKYQEVCG